MMKLYSGKGGISLAEFKKNARFFNPSDSKELWKKGKMIAKYSARSKRMTLY